MKKNYPLVFTLDAGGTNFVFSALKNGERTGQSISLPSNSHDLNACLETLKSGFSTLENSLGTKPVAISFAFPGPADYQNGIIGDLPNLPAFKDGVPLGPILENEFKVPVFINNDGDLFTLGESKTGFLPFVNKQLEDSGNSKRFRNLIGITLGTGFGVGISINGEMLQGDNSAGAEGWLLRNKLHNYTSIEDTISIKALKRIYAEQIHISPDKSPEPKDIFEISNGKQDGVREAAIETYLRFGEALGDAIAHILTLIDGLVVIGGGVSGAYPLFSRSMLDELNGYFSRLDGTRQKRLLQKVYNAEDAYQLKQFAKNETTELKHSELEKTVTYDSQKKTAVGLSRLGTSEAVSIGAYYFAINKLGL